MTETDVNIALKSIDAIENKRKTIRGGITSQEINIICKRCIHSIYSI